MRWNPVLPQKGMCCDPTSSVHPKKGFQVIKLSYHKCYSDNLVRFLLQIPLNLLVL